MNSSEALFELSLINAEESNSNFDDFFIWGTEKGIPPEILTRLKKVWDFTKVAIEESISIGKIIVNTIWKFMKAHPQLSIGLALGAAIGLLVTAIPFVGPLLAPLVATLTSLYGAGVGAAMEQDMRDTTNPIVVALSLAKSFFELLIEIFQAVKAYFEE
jgi:hypothetical protein